MADGSTHFVPEFAVAPGETLLERIEQLGISQSELAERTGRPKKTINEIINGKAAITPETALQLEQVVGPSASFWTSLEQNYRAALARIAEHERLKAQVSWLELLPVKELAKKGWIPDVRDPIAQVRAMLSFFGVASVDAWSAIWSNWREAAAFRHSVKFDSDFGTAAAWLRKGEIEARSIVCGPYSATAFREALFDIRRMSRLPVEEFCRKLVERCAAVGVAVCFVPELPRLRVHGVARWLTAQKALIQLTLRGKKDDHLWFTFFHEAGHLLHHGKREVFVEETKKSSEQQPTDHAARQREEDEANRFAQDMLIPPDEYKAFRSAAVFDFESVSAFAERIGIAPGIVVGRLQTDEELGWGTPLNKLKVTLKWVEAESV